MCSVGQFNNGKGDEFYFYTETKPLKNGWRVERKAGDGRWKTMIGEKNITRGGKTIGCKTTLSFYRGKEGKEKKTCWNMHEYKLPRENGKRKRVSSYFRMLFTSTFCLFSFLMRPSLLWGRFSFVPIDLIIAVGFPHFFSFPFGYCRCSRVACLNTKHYG